MKRKKKDELQKQAKNIAGYLKKNPKASVCTGFMPSEECDYLLGCLESSM